MRVVSSLVIFSFLMMSISSCRKDDIPTEANVTFQFEHYVDNQKIVKDGGVTYTNAAGNKYNVGLLKYYISNVVLVDDAGNETALENHDLIDAFGVSRTDATVLANANYTKMRFTFGVEAANNTSGTQSGDLDPSNGMFWSWATGYIFLKHEGKYMDMNNTEQNLEFHLGKQVSETALEIPIQGLNINGVDQMATIKFNLNNMYNSPIIDFNDGDFRHSGNSETAWMADMKANLVDVFSFMGSSEL